MPIAVSDRPYRPAPIEPRRKRWTRLECNALQATGLWQQQHLELVEGELISKMGKNRPHVNALTALFVWLLRTFGESFVNSEAPIDVAAEDNLLNQPEPGLIVLTKPQWDFQSAKPQPEDLRLVIEIADSTLGFDLTTKASLYARAGITEYWVVDIPARSLVVHREPSAGLYRSVEVFDENESVSPLAAPASAFRVRHAFEP